MGKECIDELFKGSIVGNYLICCNVLCLDGLCMFNACFLVNELRKWTNPMFTGRRNKTQRNRRIPEVLPILVRVTGTVTSPSVLTRFLVFCVKRLKRVRYHLSLVYVRRQVVCRMTQFFIEGYEIGKECIVELFKGSIFGNYLICCNVLCLDGLCMVNVCFLVSELRKWSSPMFTIRGNNTQRNRRVPPFLRWHRFWFAWPERSRRGLRPM